MQKRENTKKRKSKTKKIHTSFQKQPYVEQVLCALNLYPVPRVLQACSVLTKYLRSSSSFHIL